MDPEQSSPSVCSVPLLERGNPTGVLQCFAGESREFAPNDVTLIRWLAGQLTQGLKRIQLESRDQLLASYMRGTDEMLVGFDLEGKVTYANPPRAARWGTLPTKSSAAARSRACSFPWIAPTAPPCSGFSATKADSRASWRAAWWAAGNSPPRPPSPRR